VHMAKALPPEPVVSVGAFQIGRSNELEIDLRDVDPEVVHALTEHEAGVCPGDPVGFHDA